MYACNGDSVCMCVEKYVCVRTGEYLSCTCVYACVFCKISLPLCVCMLVGMPESVHAYVYMVSICVR